MPKKTSNDVVEKVTHFQRQILENKPTFVQMYEEIRMMKFKIRPVVGDISVLNLKNSGFIEILWSLGKLDEFFQHEYGKLSYKKRDLFLRLFDEIH
jgi:UDP-galactopyranose mutase